MKLLFIDPTVVLGRYPDGTMSPFRCPHRVERLLRVADQAGATIRHLEPHGDTEECILDVLAGYESDIPWAVVTDEDVDLGRDGWRLVRCDPRVGLTDSDADRLVGILTDGEP